MNRVSLINNGVDPRVNLISIESTNRTYSKKVPDVGWNSFYQVAFDDIINESGEGCVFNEEMAAGLYQRLKEIDNADTRKTYIHCDAGLSRSVAVGRFMATYLGFDVVYANAGTDAHANITVFNLLRREYMKDMRFS
jgi:predicted protein tyrosine phosphatase